MSARGLVHHIDLTVRDAARSRIFYDAVLGFLGYRRAADYDHGSDDALHDLLRSISATILDAPADYPRYGPTYYALFFADPDGLKLEFVFGATGG